jgi:hypothetical protein
LIEHVRALHLRRGRERTADIITAAPEGAAWRLATMLIREKILRSEGMLFKLGGEFFRCQIDRRDSILAHQVKRPITADPEKFGRLVLGHMVRS